jgi:hypothetical protein
LAKDWVHSIKLVELRCPSGHAARFARPHQSQKKALCASLLLVREAREYLFRMVSDCTLDPTDGLIPHFPDDALS